VHSFDPTPLAMDYARTHLAQTGVHFHPLGVWHKSTRLKFFAPSNRRHANFSVVDLHGTGSYCESQCERLADIMLSLGHTRIDLLKLDVEGSWMPILDDMLTSNVRPQQLCIEFDSPTSLSKMLRAINSLKGANYRVEWYHNENFLLSRAGEA
jgi:FkbM family methyltransferase